MKKQYALIGLLTIVLGSTINVSAAQTTTNFSNNKNKEQISINLSSEEQKLITQEQKSVVNEIKKLDVDDEKFSEQLNKIKQSSLVTRPILNYNKKIGRNEKIKVRYKNGEIKEDKFKKLEADILANRCIMI